jgi:RNA polymerase sigma-70 factor (ECF subfamily)
MSPEGLRRIHADGTRAWPGVSLSFEVFAAHFEQVEAGEAPDDSRFGDQLFLAFACACGDKVALDVFERETREAARMAIVHVRSDPEFVGETLQQVWDKLLCGPDARVGKYTARGPLQAWVRAVATRLALDRCRELGVATDQQAELTDVVGAPEPRADRLLVRARYGAPFQRAIEESIRALPVRERNALRMYYCGRCTIDQIGRAYQVHRATAARWVQLGLEQLREGMRGALARHDVRLTESEFFSVAREVQSQLDMRLSDCFSVDSRSAGE